MLNYSHCHKDNMMLWLNPTNIYNLFNTSPEAVLERFSSGVGMWYVLDASDSPLYIVLRKYMSGQPIM